MSEAKKILIVEDEAIISELIADLLEQLGYNAIDIVTSGTAAIASAAKNTPDLVLMDIIIKGEMDGIATATQIWKKFKIPVVYLTAHSDKATLDRAKITKVFGYVVKPFNERDLQIAIEMALNKHRMDRMAENLLTSEIAYSKETETQLIAALRAKELLFQEVHHRIKNNFQILSSFFNIQSHAIHNDADRQIFKTSEARLRSMALIHEKLYRSKGLARVEFPEYIKELVDVLLFSYQLDSNIININIQGDKVFLALEQAIPCGLIINELVVNSFKHAFPEGKSGEICIDLRVDNYSNFTLTVRDNGIGVPAELDLTKTKSLGLLLVNALTKQLRGTRELNRKGGTEFKIIFPFSVEK